MKKGLIIAIALLLLSLCVGGMAETASPTKVILDCDMGYMNDDALALSMLIKAEELGLVDILGITLEGGNNFIAAPYENNGKTLYGCSQYTYDLLNSLRRNDIPVYLGTDYPLSFDQSRIQELVSFFENLDYIKMGASYGAIHFWGAVDQELLCDSNDAAEFMIEAVRENPDEVVIFAIAPTMNIAKAIQQDDEFAPHVKAIYYMGGALGDACVKENTRSEQVPAIDGANVTAITEYNVLYDPCAFAVCIAAPFPSQYIAPGSCNIGIDQTIADEFIESSNGNIVSELWCAHYKSFIQDYPYWDPLTVYAFLKPEAIAESSLEYVTIDADRSSASFGRTDGYTAAEYEQLTPEEQARCGQALVIYQMKDFWDYAIELLCN